MSAPGRPPERWTGDPEETSLARAQAWVQETAASHAYGAECPCCGGLYQFTARTISRNDFRRLWSAYQQVGADADWFDLKPVRNALPYDLVADSRPAFSLAIKFGIMEQNEANFVRFTFWGKEWLEGRAKWGFTHVRCDSNGETVGWVAGLFHRQDVKDFSLEDLYAHRD